MCIKTNHTVQLVNPNHSSEAETERLLQDHSFGTEAIIARSPMSPVEAGCVHTTGDDLSSELWTMIVGIALKSTVWWDQLKSASRMCLVNRAWAMQNQRRRYKYAFLIAYYMTYDAIRSAEMLNYNRAMATLDVLTCRYVVGAMRTLRYGMTDMLKEMKHSYADTNDITVKDGDTHHLHQIIVESRQQIIIMRNLRDKRVLIDRFYSIVSDPMQVIQKEVM